MPVIRPKFNKKFCTMAVSAIMLTACQSHTATNPTSASITTTKSHFDQHFASDYGKKEAIEAIKHHLSKERYSVSTSHYRASAMNLTGVDGGADSVWTTVMKMSEYERNQRLAEDDGGFRTAMAYLYDDESSESALGEDLGELPYLRYDDEKAGKDVDTVSRSVGMSDEYQEHQSEIESWAYEAKSCMRSVSIDLDDLIKENPMIDNTHDDVKKALKEMETCQKDTIKSASELSKTAQGYQKARINQTLSCVANYKKGILDITQPSRQPKALEEDAYDAYDAVYENFNMCILLGESQAELEPYQYTRYNRSEFYLDANTAILVCQMSALDEQERLAQAGKTYRLHAKEYAQSIYKAVDCSVKSAQELTESEDEPPSATTNGEQARDNFRWATSTIDEYDNAEYYAKMRKKRSLSGKIDSYRQMKAQGDTKTESPKGDVGSYGRFGYYGNLMSMMLDHMKQTPEQIQALNLYQYDRTQVTQLAYYEPARQRHNILWSMDFETPTAKQSAQLPMQVDFAKGVVHADVSALLPVMAVATPKEAPLPSDVPDGLMSFALPEELALKIPSRVIFDAVQNGILEGYQSLNAEKFTPVDKAHDSFAKQIGASRVIKITLDNKEIGKLYATIAKNVANDLKAYVDENPSHYPDATAKATDKSKGVKKGDKQTDKIKQAIDDFATLNTAYRTNDVAGLFQVIEGISPLSFSNVSYLYLDDKNNIIAKQAKQAIDNDMQSARLQTISQVRYDKASFDKHALSSQFANSFTKTPAFDGGKWLGDMVNEYRYKKQAEEAREYYDEDDYQEESTDSSTDDVGDDGEYQKTLQDFYKNERN